MSKSSIGTEPVYDARTLGKPRMFILGLQHMFAMFGATVLVPALSGLDVATTLLFAGIAIILGAIGTYQQKKGRGLSIAGLVLGGLALLISLGV